MKTQENCLIYLVKKKYLKQKFIPKAPGKKTLTKGSGQSIEHSDEESLGILCFCSDGVFLQALVRRRAYDEWKLGFSGWLTPLAVISLHKHLWCMVFYIHKHWLWLHTKTSCAHPPSISLPALLSACLTVECNISSRIRNMNPVCLTRLVVQKSSTLRHAHFNEYSTYTTCAPVCIQRHQLWC